MKQQKCATQKIVRIWLLRFSISLNPLNCTVYKDKVSKEAQ